MKTYARHFFYAVIGSVLLSAPCYAGTFLFHLDKYPATTQTCPQEAQALGQRLATASGVTIDRTYCEASSTGYYDLNVVYVAPKELKTLDSLDHNRMDLVLGQGIYASATECLNDLARQREEFAAMTNTVVISAHCAKEWSRSYPYYPSIVSVVTDDAVHPRLIYNTYQLFRSIPSQAVAIGNDIETKLRATGLNVRRALFADSDVDSWFQMSYYAVQPVKFRLNKMATFENEAACETRSPAITAAYNQLDLPYYAAFCSAKDAAPSGEFYFFRALEANDPTWFTVPGNYPTRVACEADMTRVEDRYRADGVAVAGAFCQYGDGFSVVLLH